MFLEELLGPGIWQQARKTESTKLRAYSFQVKLAPHSVDCVVGRAAAVVALYAASDGSVPTGVFALDSCKA